MSSPPVYDFTWLVMMVKYSLITFLLSLIDVQLWAKDYVQQNPAVPESYPVAAESHPQHIAEQPAYCKEMFSLIKSHSFIVSIKM